MGSYVGVLNFQGVGVGVVLIRVRRGEGRSQGSWVRRERGLSVDSGIKFNNL